MTQTRIILFTGKGGVGKTTLSAATGVRAAELGYKTLVMSTDPAHSLADALDCALGPEPTPVLPNLHGQELDVYYSIKKYWGNMRQLIMSIVKWQGVDRMIAEEMAVLPGMEELSAFLWLEHFYQTGDYDLIVIDSAPTGETLKHLTLPQVGQWWLTRVLPVQKLAGKPLGSMVRMVTGVPLDTGLEELETFYRKLMRIHTLMSDPQICSMRLVLNPERMVIQETLRAYTYLQLYGYAVDAVMVNRIFPSTSPKSLFSEYVKAQQGYLAEIEETLAPLPIFHVPHLGQEVFGLERLRQLAGQLYQERDPRDIFYKEAPYQFIEQKNGYLLSIHLPFLDPTDITVSQNSDELVIQAKAQRRHLFLPRFLAYYHVTNYQMMADRLLVRFEKEPAPAEPPKSKG
jgi:arsenite-transporting ATPase